MNESTTRLLKLLNTSTYIDDFISRQRTNFVDLEFTELLNEFYIRTGQSRYQILNAAKIDTNYGYQIFNGKRKPTRSKIILLSLAMQVSLNEIQLLLLSLDERQLYVRNKRDAIIMYALENKLSVIEVEKIIDDQNEIALCK